MEDDPASQDFGHVICLDVGRHSLSDSQDDYFGEAGQQFPLPPTPHPTAKVIQAPTAYQPEVTPPSNSEVGHLDFPLRINTQDAVAGVVCMLAFRGAQDRKPSRFRHQASQIEPTPPHWSPPMSWDAAFQTSWEPFIRTINAALNSAHLFQQETGYEWTCVTS